MTIRNEHVSPENFKTAYLQGSQDNTNWTNLITINGTNTGSYETIINANFGFYKFNRLYFVESFSTGGVSIQTIELTGRCIL